MNEQRLISAARAARLARIGVLAGMAVALIAFPSAALFGMAAKVGADALSTVSVDLGHTPPPQTSYLYAADGRTLITEFYTEDRRQVPLSATSGWIQQAVIAAEDSRFFEHHGVDTKGAIRAFVANQRAGTVAQGASTLTMQYVRNALRDEASSPQEAVDATEQSAGRKIHEAKLATELERTWSKQKILAGYLNVAYFGHRAYGIWAASKIYFSKSPADLTLPEAALLAGVVQAPSAYDPTQDPTAAVTRRNHVLDRMADVGYLSADLARTTKASPLALRVSSAPNDCVAIPDTLNDWGYFCDVFKQWWLRQPQFGRNASERLDRLRSGGYTIVGSLDPRIQAAAHRTVLAKEPLGSRFALGEAVVQPGTGLVKALAVNRRYAIDQSGNGPSSSPQQRAAGVRGSYPNTVSMLLGGGDETGYQAGSTFKMFTMLAALAKGYPLNTAIYSPNKVTTGYGDRSPTACGGHWCPSNASASMTGNHTMFSAFGRSVNTYWVQLEQRIGAASVVAMAERLGLTWHTAIDRELATPAQRDTWGAFTLGVASTTPLEMATAYAAVAADGRYCQSMPVQSITGPDGKPASSLGVAVAAPRCAQVVAPQVARAAADAARCPTGYGAAKGSCGGTGTFPSGARSVGRPFAGKTGTTNSAEAEWFVGFTPDLAAASFIADPDNPSNAVGSANAFKPNETVAGTVRAALAGSPVRYFAYPPGSIVGTPPAHTSSKKPAARH